MVFARWKRRFEMGRVEPGGGRPLQRFRWWQHLTRALYHLELPEGRHSIDVRYGGSGEGGEVRARLFREGIEVAVGKAPVTFPVPGGVVEVAVSQFGLKRCRFVAESGPARNLVPDPASTDGRRMAFARRHPRADRLIGVAGLVFLVIGVGLLGLQFAETITQLPPVAEVVGTFTSPVHLPVWLNTALTLGSILASMDRAMRLRYHWLLDGASD